MDSFMKLNWQSISKDTFLKEYWQKKPILLKNALPDLPPLIEPEELAGLAMESFIDSRVVTAINNDWTLMNGPFEDFGQFGDQNWSLLVQGVDNWFESVDTLKRAVDFIPKWRIDDVMISFSTPNGGVGPHCDQYDVFIVQGVGTRRWQVGAVDRDIKQMEATTGLQHVAPFQPIIDCEVTNGDVLYIPPFSPHQGDTIQNSIAYSIGFRAPSSQELLSGFADHVIDNNIGLDRFIDTPSGDVLADFGLSHKDVEKMQQQIASLVADQSLIEQFLLTRLTAATRELNIEPLIEPLSINHTNSLFLQECEIQKVLGVKLALSQKSDVQTLFCDGEAFQISSHQLEFAQQLVSTSATELIKLKKNENCIENNQLLTTLINYGYFFIVNDDELQD